MSELLRVEKLSLEFRTRSGTVSALQDVSLSLARGETLGLVGESGSGKSVLSYAILGIQDPAARITTGSVHFAGMNLLELAESQLADVRGREIAMIFQNPRVALNPIRRVGDQIGDVLERHTTTLARDRSARSAAMLQAVRIPDPQRRARAYPFEMSGGQCQRVMIAMALSSNPALLIADEPTTGLDVTTQAAIMQLLRDAAADREMATVLITHDLALASENCDRIAVMHAGHIVEVAPTRELFERPRHPYTAALIRSVPASAGSLTDLQPIPGSLPDLRAADIPPGRCADRCPRAQPVCRSAPLPVALDGASMVACHFPL
jgi:oligopeptide/dipeptide ABC transporter ATP-binding protein